jgi:hypothetical protein
MNLFSVWDSDALEIAHDHFILRRRSEDRTARLHQRKQKARKNMPARKFSCKARKESATNKDFKAGFR